MYDTNQNMLFMEKKRENNRHERKQKKTIAINGFFLTAITDFNRLLNISSHGNEKQQRGYFPVKLIDIR